MGFCCDLRKKNPKLCISSCLPLGLPKQLRAKLSIPALLTVLFIIEFLLANILITVWSSL